MITIAELFTYWIKHQLFGFFLGRSHTVAAKTLTVGVVTIIYLIDILTYLPTRESTLESA